MSKRMACTGGAAEEEEGAAAAAAAAVVVEVEGEKVVRRGKLGLGECVCACPCASRPEPLLPALADVANELLRPPMPWAASPNIHAPVIFFFWKGDAKRASVFFFSRRRICALVERLEKTHFRSFLSRLSLLSFLFLPSFLSSRFPFKMASTVSSHLAGPDPPSLSLSSVHFHQQKRSSLSLPCFPKSTRTQIAARSSMASTSSAVAAGRRSAAPRRAAVVIVRAGEDDKLDFTPSRRSVSSQTLTRCAV